MKISVITPTIRPEGLNIVQRALQRQTMQDFEWLVGSAFVPLEECVWVQDDFKGGVWTLNRIYNALLKEAKGELIVSVQDYTFFDPTSLERFWTHYSISPTSIISGVGDKYDTVYPDLGEKIWEDPRRRGMYELRPAPFYEVEGNFCSIPMGAFKSIGGFDEQLDYEGYGMDFYSVLERLHYSGGWEFYVDENIESFSLTHGRVKDWEDKNLIHGGYKRHSERYKEHPKLNYLG